MTAATQDLATTDKLGTDELPEPALISLPVAANTIIYAGTMVATDASGNAIPATTAPTAKVIWGRCERQVDNRTANTPYGAAGAQQVLVRPGAYYFAQDATITQANVGQNAYAVDDSSVSLSDNGGTRILAGVIEPGARFKSSALLSTDAVAIRFQALPQSGTSVVPATQNVSLYKARSVGTANHSLVSFVGVTGGSSTNTDGVLAVAGDIVLLTAQTAAAENGPYVVGTVTAGTAPLTRPFWFETASTQSSGFAISVGGEGTIYKNTLWKACVAASTFVVGTTDGKFYPLSVTFSAALVAGTLTAGAGATAGAPANLPVFSANSSLSITRKTANTTAATVMYALNGAPTPGVPGTGAISAMATVAAGTINVADISTMLCTLINQI